MAHADVLMYNALNVMLKDNAILNWLRYSDPKAFAQAQDAIRTFEEEQKGAEPEPEWVVDLYIPFTCVPEGAESAEEAEALARNVFASEGLYERLLEALEGTVFSCSDSEWRTEVGC